MFNMYDLDGSGELDLDEFHEMLRFVNNFVDDKLLKAQLVIKISFSKLF